MNVKQLTPEQAKALRAILSPGEPRSSTDFIARLEPHFRFAKTLAATPHYYVRRADVEEADYVALYTAIKEHGIWEIWPGSGHRYKYLYHDGWKYWYMGALYQSRIINRARVEPDTSSPRLPGM